MAGVLNDFFVYETKYDAGDKKCKRNETLGWKTLSETKRNISFARNGFDPFPVSNSSKFLDFLPVTPQFRLTARRTMSKSIVISYGQDVTQNEADSSGPSYVYVAPRGRVSATSSSVL